MKQFTVADDFNLYKNNTFTFEKGLTCLIGPNGSGKSTLLGCIQRQLEKENLACFKYDNYQEGGSTAHSHYGFTGQMDLLATTMCSSEGQQIMINYGQTLQRIGSFVRKNIKDGVKEIYILLDALDSGLSINNILEIKKIFKLILGEDTEADIYIIATANSYEMVRGVDCVAVKTGKLMAFRDYAHYAGFICNTK